MNDVGSFSSKPCSKLLRTADLAQLVEQLFRKQQVVGSIPAIDICSAIPLVKHYKS